MCQFSVQKVKGQGHRALMDLQKCCISHVITACAVNAPQIQRGFPIDIVCNTNLLTYLLTELIQCKCTRSLSMERMPVHHADNYVNIKQMTRGLIHRRCHKIYLMICLRTIATQKLRYPKMTI